MKYILFLTFVLFLGGCTFNEKQDTTISSTDFKKLDTTLSFAGYWLSESYLKDIQQHKSPQKSQEGSEDCMVIIPERTLQPTSLIWNFHEGSPEMRVVKNGNQYQLYESVEDSLTQLYNTIKILSPTKISIGEKDFVKITPHINSGEAGNPLILEEILFKGAYILPDGQKVIFKNNGQVNGLDDFQFYEAAIDYIGPGMQVDQLSLSATKDKKNWMGFKFQGDTLLVFNLKCVEYDKANETCGWVDFGELKYTLVKQK